MQPQKADVALRSSEWNMGSRSVCVSLFLLFSIFLSLISYISLATGLRFPINGRVPLHDPHHRALSTVMVFRSWLPCRSGAAVRCILARCRQRCVAQMCVCVCVLRKTRRERERKTDEMGSRWDSRERLGEALLSWDCNDRGEKSRRRLPWR